MKTAWINGTLLALTLLTGRKSRACPPPEGLGDTAAIDPVPSPKAGLATERAPRPFACGDTLRFQEVRPLADSITVCSPCLKRGRIRG